MKVVLDRLEPGSANQPVFTVQTAEQKVIQLVLKENTGSTGSKAPYLVEVILENDERIEGKFRTNVD